MSAERGVLTVKKLLCLALCLCLVLTVLPCFASAEEEALTKEEQVIQTARQSYLRSRATAGRTSFHGYCGLMISHQLYNLGINDWCIIQDGKNQFDYYKTMEVTTGGYYINAYYAEEYMLEEALNAATKNGTRDAYNLMVGFQWTNTEAGARYGHVVLINAILDGTVYFVESFDLSLDRMYPEGTVITCSIAEFAAYFDRWTQFDGIISFGSGHYSDKCQELGTNVFLQTRFDSVLRSEPCLVGTNGCTRLRDVAAGERLHATAILDDDGKLYYRIREGDRTGYIAAGAVGVLRINPEDLDTGDIRFPEVIDQGERVTPQGTVYAENAAVSAVEILVTDSMENLVLRERLEVSGSRVSLEGLGELLYFDLLEPGVYWVELCADVECPAVMGSDTRKFNGRVTLWGQVLQVGGGLRNAKAQPTGQKSVAQEHEGWIWEDGRWYLYRDAQAVTGWVKQYGVSYYLDDTGAAVTGWQNMDGAMRWFSDTGAMCTGWLTLDGSTTYRLEDGTAAVGWQQIGTALYYFSEEGTLVTGGEMTKDDTVYVLADDGRATVKE